MEPANAGFGVAFLNFTFASTHMSYTLLFSSQCHCLNPRRRSSLSRNAIATPTSADVRAYAKVKIPLEMLMKLEEVGEALY
jgi:hypothetical protein